jgi:uncharacterized membrane-anchored protein
MPEGVVYKTIEEAEAYAEEVGGWSALADNFVIKKVPGGFAVIVVDTDELGYARDSGANQEPPRDPIKYSKGGAVKGKGFAGSY